jgi:hypothetical protein
MQLALVRKAGFIRHIHKYDEQYAVAADCCFRDVTALVATAQKAVVAARGASSFMTGVAAAAPKRAWRQKERILILELGRHSGDSTLQ